MKTMFLQFDDLEYEVIPSPKRKWVMDVLRREMKSVSVVAEVMWAFRIDGRCMKALGRTRTEALGELGYGVKDFDRIDRHGPLSEAVADGWWVEPKPIEFKSPKGLKMTMDHEDKVKAAGRERLPEEFVSGTVTGPAELGESSFCRKDEVVIKDGMESPPVELKDHPQRAAGRERWPEAESGEDNPLDV